MFAKRFPIFLFLVLAFLASYAGIVTATVCRLPGLQGFDGPAQRAKATLPNTTSDQRKAAVYIENTADGLYFHSNYVTPGADHPTKIGGEKIDDAAIAFVNIVHAERISDDAWRETERVFHDDVKIYLNENVFGENGIPLVDLRGAKNISVVSKNATTSLIASSIETLSRNKPPPLILKKIAGCCFFGIPPHLASKYAEALKARSFQSKEVRFLSLVRDSATEAAIRNAPHVQKANLRESGKVLNLADIEASFKDAKGKTVVLIGHVEGENFVTRNARSEVALSVSIHDLRASASKYGIELIDLGCRTAQQISKDSLGVGVTTRFNTVDAVNSINRAMSHSKNYEEFFENLTSGGLKVVVDGEFARGSALRAEIYSEQKASARRFWVPIADIFVTFISKK
jgi:hypothetical protein